MFRGCFRRPDNLSLALPVTAAMPNMSVDKCVDLCTEKVSAGSCSQDSEEGQHGAACRKGSWLERQRPSLDKEGVSFVICDTGEGHDGFMCI